MTEFIQKGEKKVQVNKVSSNPEKDINAEELKINELEQVVGGISLRDVDKVDTTDVSDDTKSKV